jgi:hypothetical protein
VTGEQSSQRTERIMNVFVSAADDEAARLRSLLTAVVVAAGRMRDAWAEADDAVRQRLWRELHAAATAAEDEVYPLA